MKQSARFLESCGSSVPVQTQVKVCGITRPEDAIHATHCGADALGFVFYPPSRRNVSSETVNEIREQLDRRVALIAVVVDPDDDLLDDIVSNARPDFIQFHGNESPGRCRESGIPFIKAFRVRNARQLKTVSDEYSDARALLFDAFVPDKVGGTGMTFSWKLLPETQMPTVLAGGLNLDNVAEAIGKVKPSAVDVSTGVEISPGIKDKQAITRFLATVHAVDQSASRAAR